MSVTAECFLDSNVLVYALSLDPKETRKREVARSLISEAEFGISVQVLQEVYVTATQKFSRQVAGLDVLRFLIPFTRFPLVESGLALFFEAEQISRRFRIHYYDGAIIAAAKQLGARLLYSEDFNQGQDYGGVIVENPFAGN